jgi:hypothetical protein
MAFGVAYQQEYIISQKSAQGVAVSLNAVVFYSMHVYRIPSRPNT